MIDDVRIATQSGGSADPANDGFDFDLDGVCGLSDNCLDDPNADQSDIDGDSIGDVCDPEAIASAKTTP